LISISPQGGFPPPGPGGMPPPGAPPNMGNFVFRQPQLLVYNLVVIKN